MLLNHNKKDAPKEQPARRAALSDDDLEKVSGGDGYRPMKPDETFCPNDGFLAIGYDSSLPRCCGNCAYYDPDSEVCFNTF